ncbi:MAG: c-type cytochrome [Cyclobacteriaceae bacterium]|nr:c-type cytochrome [Cyclobacteriaceae bacterium]
MKKRKILNVSLLSLAFVAFALFAFKPVVNYQEGWEVPEEYKNMENPMAGDDEAMEIGGELYDKHCKSCHGKTGLGDGPKAAELDTASGDFTTEEFQAQADGELFYKTTFGRDDMPTFEKKISDDDDRWVVITYIRSLKEQKFALFRGALSNFFEIPSINLAS